MGGSSRIPCFRAWVSEFFDNDEDDLINDALNPLDAVARGATVMAKLLTPDEEEEKNEEVKAPYDIGI